MKPIHSLILFAALLLASCGGGQKEAPTLETFNDTLSWAYGQNIADALQTGYLDSLDKEMVLRSVEHALKGGDQPLTEQETRQALDYIVVMYQQSMRMQASATKDQVEAMQRSYFADLTAKNPKVKQHPAGFYYEVVREGKGPKAKYAQRIKFDYKSFLLLSGEPYDQTYGHRDPIVHVVGEPMFAGLIQGFQLMNAGSLYRFYFPYQLAFGENGSGDIPGFTPLIYEVELHELYDN